MAHGNFTEEVTEAEAEEIIELMEKVLEGAKPLPNWAGATGPAQLGRRKAARQASKAGPSGGASS